MATGGRQALRDWPAPTRRKAGLARSPESNALIGGSGGIDGAIGHARRDGRSADVAEQPALKGLRIGRIHAHQVDHAARQDVAEQAEAAAQHGCGAICQASAVRGCRMASGVAAKTVPCPVRIAWSRG
jgi:hypothetical protein